MSIDTEKLRERGKRLAEETEPRTRSPDRPATYGAGEEIARVVLRSVDLEARTLHFKRIRYSTSPPQEGEYETYGELTTGYPLETAKCEDYLNFVWPEELAVQTQTVPLLAVRSRGAWILWVPFKVDGSLLPADETVNECSFG